MFLTRNEYDRGVNTFSPEGRLFQVEYAIQAIKTSEGVVLAVEKRITSPLMEPESLEKIVEVDSHIGCTMSGLTADATQLIEFSRVEAQNHRFTYDEPISLDSCMQSTCDIMMRFGDNDRDDDSHRMSRPYGVSILLAGVDEKGPALYHADPSGTYMKCEAQAIGSGSEGAQSSLQEDYNKSMTLEQAETLALKILKQVMEEKVTTNNVEIAAVRTSTGKFSLYNEAQLTAVIDRVVAEEARNTI